MKKIKNYFFACLLALSGVLVISSGGGDTSSSVPDQPSYNSTNPTREYKNVSGESSPHLSTCRTCGISYTVARLPYGKYCSQSCCITYEGLSSECGY